MVSTTDAGLIVDNSHFTRLSIESNLLCRSCFESIQLNEQDIRGLAEARSINIGLSENKVAVEVLRVRDN